MISICCRGQGAIVKDTQSKLKVYKAKCTIASILAVMFGLGWTLGLAATSVPVKEISLTFQILFSIFVGAQGALIFFLHGVRNQDTRKLWKIWLKAVGDKSGLSTISFSFARSEAAHSGCDSTLQLKKDSSAPAATYLEKQAVRESNLYATVDLKTSSEDKGSDASDKLDEKQEMQLMEEKEKEKV